MLATAIYLKLRHVMLLTIARQTDRDRQHGTTPGLGSSSQQSCTGTVLQACLKVCQALHAIASCLLCVKLVLCTELNVAHYANDLYHEMLTAQTTLLLQTVLDDTLCRQTKCVIHPTRQWFHKNIRLVG